MDDQWRQGKVQQTGGHASHKAEMLMRAAGEGTRANVHLGTAIVGWGKFELGTHHRYEAVSQALARRRPSRRGVPPPLSNPGKGPRWRPRLLARPHQACSRCKAEEVKRRQRSASRKRQQAGLADFAARGRALALAPSMAPAMRLRSRRNGTMAARIAAGPRFAAVSVGGGSGVSGKTLDLGAPQWERGEMSGSHGD